jgi:glycosyltransferase involved in cell wall biosynthesis
MPSTTHDGAAVKLRVLYFIGSYGPDVMGNASHEETIIALRERGHAVDVLTQITRPGEPRFSKAVFEGVPVYRVNLASPGGLVAGLVRKAAARFLRYEYLGTLLSAYHRQFRKRKYDLVHVEGAYPYGFIAALGNSLHWPRLKYPPYIANVQGADVIDLPDYDYGYRRYPVPRMSVKYALDKASLIRVISTLLGEYLEKEKLASSDRVVTILRAIEEAAFPPPGRSLADVRAEGRAMLSEKYGIGLPRPVIMSLSRLHPFKGLEYLVDALKIVVDERRQEGEEPPWLIVGGPSRSTENYGDYRDFLRKRAEAARVSSYLIFTGQIEHSQVRSHLAGADIFACPSILEAQNKVVPEAAAVGTPSVVTETTGIASYFAPHDACVSVPPSSARALAEAILRLLRDRQFYKEVSDNALRLADTLRVEAVAPQLEAAWYRAAGKGQGVRG